MPRFKARLGGPEYIAAGDLGRAGGPRLPERSWPPLRSSVRQVDARTDLGLVCDISTTRNFCLNTMLQIAERSSYNGG